MLLPLVGLAACSEAPLDTLRGRWAGEVNCVDGPIEIGVTLDVFDLTVFGDGFTRQGGVDQMWQVQGTQASVEKEVDCLDDSCQTAVDCLNKGGGDCNPFGQCVDCKESRMVLVVSLTLSDANVQFPDPKLQLDRSGSDLMTGTITSLCPGEGNQAPAVTVTKQ